MSPTPLSELADGRTEIKPLTVEQYHRMLDTGILEEGEPYELLDGFLVRKDRSAAGADPMTIDPHHAWAVKQLAKLGRKVERFGCHVQTQQPLTLPPYDEPEPDGAIIAGGEDLYRERHPGAGDVRCVIEVADASLRRDRTTKFRIYASVGIEQYVIVNLPDRVVEVYAEPLAPKGRYGRAQTFPSGEKVAMNVGGGKTLAVAVRSLLP